MDNQQLELADQPDTINLKHDDQEKNIRQKEPLRRSAFRAIVQDFGPIWYVVHVYA